MQFLSLLLKPNVYNVWLARGGRKKVESDQNSTDHPLNYAWNQSNIKRIGQSFNFSNCKLGKTQKKWGVILKTGSVSCIVCI